MVRSGILFNNKIFLIKGSSIHLLYGGSTSFHEKYTCLHTEISVVILTKKVLEQHMDYNVPTA